MGSAIQESATFDEPQHLSYGWSLLSLKELPKDNQAFINPPLLPMLFALPAWLIWDIELQPIDTVKLSRNLTLAADNPIALKFLKRSQSLAFRFLYRSNVDADLLLLSGRLVNLLLFLLGGIGVFLWSRDLFGFKGGFLSVFLYLLCPNLLAHARLTTPDLGVAVFTLWSAFALHRAVYKNTLSRWVFFGIIMGITLLTKFSAVTIGPPFLLMIGHFLLKQRKYNFTNKMISLKKVSVENLFFYGLISILLALIFIWVFGLILDYHRGFPAWGGVQEEFKMPTWLRKDVGAPYQPITDPWHNYLSGFFLASKADMPQYFCGKHAMKGWYEYFLVAFLIKTPLAFIIMLVLCGFLIMRLKPREGWVDLSLWLPAFVFLLASWHRFNIGLRHILMIYPFLHVFAGRLVNIGNCQPTFLKGKRRIILILLIIILCAWYLKANLNIYPHYLAYFNELIGGPDNGYRYLLDCNLDWGQDLKGLALYQKKHQLGKFYLYYFGSADPDYYKLIYEFIPPRAWQNPAPGLYAVSATFLYGLYGDSWNSLAEFRKMKPFAKIGYSIFLYKIL